MLHVVGRLHGGRVVGVCFDMLFQILRPLEALVTKAAFVWFEWYVYTHVRSDMITLYGGDATETPCAREVEIISRFSADMSVAHVVL